MSVAQAGNKVRTTDVIVTSTSYSPVWSASTTAPTNYTSTGWYFSAGKIVFFHAQFTPGASFTAGSGNYTFSLPVAMSSSLGLEDSIGTGLLRDTSGSARYRLLLMPTSAGASTVFAMQGGSTISPCTNAAPVAPANGDQISIDGWYLID